MDRERAIKLASRVVFLTDRIERLQAEKVDAEERLEIANSNMKDAAKSLDKAVGELLDMGNGSDRRERHAEFAPERVSEVNRKWRWRGSVRAVVINNVLQLKDGFGPRHPDDVKEFFYRSPVYALLAKELGMGTQDTYVPKSGQTYR